MVICWKDKQYKNEREFSFSTLLKLKIVRIRKWYQALIRGDAISLARYAWLVCYPHPASGLTTSDSQ